MADPPTYVLITPARNEAQFLEQTIQSVVAQSVRPLQWVIVSDGSTDGTDEIVKRYAARHPWIQLLRMPARQERHFAGKVDAFNAGYALLRDLPYDVIGSLDGDISFGSDYFSFLLQKLARNPRLGLVGTPFREGATGTYDYRFSSIEHVSGACQLFRRQCFEEIGGYVPIRGGGVDRFMVVSARMNGWKTRTFVERVCLHHRPMGTARQGVLKARYLAGIKDYVFGNHPLWELVRVVYQATQRPAVVGAAALASGYAWALTRQIDRPVSPDFVTFTRNEQLRRLRAFATRQRACHDIQT